MDQEKHTETFMTKLSRFIVDKRKAFYLVFLAAFLFCAASINKVEINNDITSYLPADTETRRGLTLMDEEFVTLGSADVMVSNIPLETAQELCHKLEILPGVSGVTFDDSADHYHDSAALFSVTFDAPEDDPEAVTALQAVQDALEGYDVYVSTQVGRDESASLQKEMTVILAIAAAVIVVVLLFTSKSYMEVPVYLIVFAAAAVLNMGTNFIFGTISFITNSIAVVLQLALAIDYAIIFCHRYMEERDNGLDPREADIAALSKAIVEISSSSLTTISGLVALMLMQLRIGFDMGIVLAKGIVCSMLCVFLLMPGLLMLFSRPIERTRHKNLVPDIGFWGRGVVKLRYILPPIFLVVLVAGAILSSKCEYVFDTNDADFDNKPDWRIAEEKVTDTFGKKNTIAVLVPRGDYEKEKAVLQQVEALGPVTSATGLANIEVEDGRVLTDALTPRQFSELAGVDIELCRLLYQAYGLSVEEYGAIFQNPDDYAVPLIDVFEFLLEQKDKGVVNLTGDQEQKVEDLREELDLGLEQLRGENWSRLVFVADVPTEGDETYALLDQIRAIAQAQYGDDVILVGNSTNAFDLASSFSGDNLKISILTALFVMVILLFTFKSAGLPILLVLTIQGSIWINFSIPCAHRHQPLLPELSGGELHPDGRHHRLRHRHHQPLPGAQGRHGPERGRHRRPEPELPHRAHLGHHHGRGRLPHRRHLHRRHHRLRGPGPGPGHRHLHFPGDDRAAPDAPAGRRPHRAHRHHPQPGPEAALQPGHHAPGRPRPRPRVRLCGRRVQGGHPRQRGRPHREQIPGARPLPGG